MILSQIVDVDKSCLPCKFCGNLPKLVINYYNDFSKVELCCMNEDPMCCENIISEFMDKNHDFTSLINKWNKENIK